MRKAKQIALGVLSACMLAGMPVLAQEPDTEQISETSAMQLLEDVRGTYDELFAVTNAPEYDQIWIDACVPFVGEEAAEETADMLKNACSGTIYGQEAIDVYGDGSNGAQFDCFFINGVSQIVFDGTTISGLDENGEEVFSHTYSFAGDFSIAGMMDGFLYEADDEDAGDFRYFLMMPDTPASTYHIEFRYGSDKDDLAKYNEGKLAYWLAAGILTDRDDQMVTDVIDLFCSENLSEMQQETPEEAVTETVTEAAVLPEAEEVIEISTAEELAAINDNLSGHYVLTADIDLGGEEWTPIGSYAPSGESEEEQEIPSAEYAFSGTFDGQGHTISNLSIHQPDGWALGLFGCIANTKVGNFTLENAEVEGTIMVSCVVGYSYCSEVYGVQLTGGKVDVNYTEVSSEGMYGGIVGAGMGSLISGCEASADVNLPDGVANAGIIGGGLEMTSVVDCTATGTVTAGNDCYGLGAISGCGFGAEEFTNCYAHDVTITAGEGNTWIGKITGYAGGFEDESAGIPVTVFTNCSTENVTIDVPEGTEGVGEIVGSGFYSEEAAQALGAPYDQPTVFVISEEEQENAA